MFSVIFEIKCFSMLISHGFISPNSKLVSLRISLYLFALVSLSLRDTDCECYSHALEGLLIDMEV